MRRFVITIFCLITFGQLITESWHLVWWVMGDKALVNVNYFINKALVPEGQNVLWYVKDLSVSLKDTIWVFCFAMVAGKVSRKLMWIGYVWAIYFLFDAAVYMIDYRRSYLGYAIVTPAIILSSLLAFKKDKPTAKLVEM